MSKLYVDELHPKTSGGVVTNPKVPAFDVQANTNQSITAGTATVIAFGEVVDDNLGNFDTATNAFVAPADGFYFFTFNVLLQDVASGDDDAFASFRKNGSDFQHFGRLDGASANGSYGYGGYVEIQGSTCVKLLANDKVDVKISCSGAISLHGQSGGRWSHFSGFLIG